jgi:hypothetical protein
LEALATGARSRRSTRRAPTRRARTSPSIAIGSTTSRRTST